MPRFGWAVAVALTIICAEGWKAPAVNAGATDSELPQGSLADESNQAGHAHLLRAGDTVKVSIYELIDVAGDGQPPGGSPSGVPQALKSYFQRMDLSGDYVVQQDGSVSMPRLGSVMASGRDMQDVREEIQASFAQVMGTPAEVNLTITRRQPIYVVGAVKNSGAYEYVAGMMVIQAISLAGGLERGAPRSAQIIERVRQAEKLDQTRDRLNRLIARKARLDADGGDGTTVGVPSRLKELAGATDAERLIATESGILEAVRRARSANLNELDMRISSTERQLALLRQRAIQFDAQMQARVTRIGLLQGLQERGGVVQASLLTAQSDLSDIEGKKKEFEITLAQTEQGLEATRGARTKIETEAKLQLSRELTQTAAEIADAERGLTADATTVQTLNAMAAQEGLIDFNAIPVLEIIRRNKAARSIIPAEDTTELSPGDVVRVRLRSARELPTGGTLER